MVDQLDQVVHLRTAGLVDHLADIPSAAWKTSLTFLDRSSKLRGEDQTLATCYHTTSATAADLILKNGFRDAPGVSLSGEEINGVFLSAEPLSDGDGMPQETPPEKYARVLRVEFPDDFELDNFVYDAERPPTWHLPAAEINQHATVKLWSDEQAGPHQR